MAISDKPHVVMKADGLSKWTDFDSKISLRAIG